MTTPIKTPRKLIEVALPLDDINAAAAREKSIRHGHLHIPAHRDRPFRLNVTACSGWSYGDFWCTRR
jgi:hypothetical protein